MVSGAAPRSRSARIIAAVCSIHLPMNPFHIARNSGLVASASVPARAIARCEVNAVKNALMPLRQTRRGSLGSRCTAPTKFSSAAAISGSSNESSTASLDLK